MTVRLITPPAAEPVTLEMARLHTRAEAVEDDAPVSYTHLTLPTK